MTTHNLAFLQPWLPSTKPLRLLDIGCGAADEAAVLLNIVDEFVGVDLDETAIAKARVRWPQATFMCADAAILSPEAVGSCDVVLIHRPDIFAQPARWRRVFDTLPVLFQPGGRIILTLMGEAETATARAWLAEIGLSVIHASKAPEAGGAHLLVAESGGKSERSAPPLTLIRLNAGDGEGMTCDPLTGVCIVPDDGGA